MNVPPNKSVPTFRFPEFKGEWNIVPFNKFLLPNFREVPKPSSNYLSIGIRSHGKGTFQKPDSDPSKIAMESLFSVKANDLIVNITFAWEGAIAIVKPTDQGGLVSHRFPTYEFDSKRVTHEFFQFIINQRRFRKELGLISPGGAGRNRVMSKPAFLKLSYPIPSTAEQKKISAFLGAVDKKLAKLQHKWNLLADYKRGVMQQIFSRTLRFTKDNAAPFPDWKKVPFSDIAEINPKSENLPNEFEYIDLESVSNGILGETKRVKKSNAPSRAQRLLTRGDILFQTVRPYQKNNLLFDLPCEYVASTGYAQIRSKICNLFVYHLIHTENFGKDVFVRCTGTSYPAINSNDLKTIRVTIPSHPKEQQKIADFLSAIDDKIEVVAEQISQMQAFKKGLLQQMFV